MAKRKQGEDIKTREDWICLSALAYSIVSRAYRYEKLKRRQKRTLKKVMAMLKEQPERDWFNDELEKELFIKTLCLAKCTFGFLALDTLVGLQMFSPKCRAFYEECKKEAMKF